MSHAPNWPGWTIPLVLLGVLGFAVLALVAAALVGVGLGGDELTPAVLVLGVALNLGGLWLILRRVSARADIDLEPAHLGLRRVSPRMAAVMLGFGLFVAVVAAALTAAFTDPVLELPRELGDEQTLVQLDFGTAASVFARAVLGAITAEVLLRGFALPALIGVTGRTAAILLLSLLTALTGILEFAPAAAAVSIALCVMYLESGSLIPGIGLHAAVQAFVLGLSFDWSVPESAGLALAAGFVAVALVAGPIRAWDPGPARS
jgi:membrane protease YdiL (CAAX protease family)